jgi:hypothetical protein
MIITNIKPQKISHLSEFLKLGILSDTACLSGGAAMSIVDKTHVFDDYDVFFLIKPEPSNPFVNPCSELSGDIIIPDEMHAAAWKLLNDGYELIYKCPKNTVYSYKKGEMKIQLIVGRHSEIDIVLHHFDMVQCKVAYNGRHLHVTRDTLRCIFRKHIKFSRSVTNPIRTIARMMKYHKNKGYDVEIFELYRLCSHNHNKMHGDEMINDLSFYL